jgi:hypothetical protein
VVVFFFLSSRKGTRAGVFWGKIDYVIFSFCVVLLEVVNFFTLREVVPHVFESGHRGVMLGAGRYMESLRVGGRGGDDGGT